MFFDSDPVAVLLPNQTFHKVFWEPSEIKTSPLILTNIKEDLLFTLFT